MGVLRRKAVRGGAGLAEIPAGNGEVPGYRLVEPVGHGGFSVVYRARQEALDRIVALKVLSAGHADERARQRFFREVWLTTRLSGHPHVVTVLDAGITRAGQPYIAMDYFDSGSLHDRLAAQGPLPPAEVAAIGAKIGGALAAAHELGILHRDIKPQNILVSRFGEPALADFGVALLASAASSTGRTDALTPCHAAPEILGGAEPSAAADIYSLGSALYELLAGRPAYQQEGSGIGPLVMRIMHEPPPPLTRPDIPGALHAAVLRAMSKDPAERFGTAASFAAALASAQDDEGAQSAMRPPVMAPGHPATPATGLSGHAETVFRPGRESARLPAETGGRRARPGWLGPQLALAAGVIAVLAVGGVFLGMRHASEVKRAAAPRQHRVTATIRRGAPTAGPRHSPKPPSAPAPSTAPPPSSASAASSAPAPQAPSAPQSLTVAATANHAVTLTWSAPASGGGAPVTYTIAWNGPVSGSRTGLSGTSFQVTGLANSATYSFSVSAANTAGTGQPATTSQALIPPSHPFNTFRNTQLPLLVDSQPNTHSQVVATIPVLNGNLGPQVIVACQVTGQGVTDPVDGTLSGDLWDKVSYQGITGYISDLYVDTPQSAAGNFGSFSDPPLWECQ